MAVDVPGGRAFDISADRHAGQLKKRDRRDSAKDLSRWGEPPGWPEMKIGER